MAGEKWETRDSVTSRGRRSAQFGNLVAAHLLPTFTLVVGVVAVGAGLLFYSAHQQNSVAQNAGRHLAQTAISVVTEEIEAFVRDYAYWDATAENLIVDYNPDWADENVGSWVIEGLEMSGALVFGAENRVINAADFHDADRFREAGQLQKSLVALITHARDASRSGDDMPPAATGVFRDGYGTHLAAAAVIRWEDGTDGPLDGSEPGVLLFYRTIDETMLANLEARFLLNAPRLVLNDPGGGMVPLRSVDGRVLAGLAWQSETPGTDMLKNLAFPLLASVVVMSFLVGIIVVRAMHSARQVRIYQADLEAQTRKLSAAWSEAENANRSKSRFLAMMSHELRTPLNAVIGFSDFMRQAPQEVMTYDRVRGYAEDIHTSGTYLLALINDILDMSKIESNRYELYEEEIDLDPILDQSTALVRGMAKERGVRLSVPPTGKRLRVDARALKQILLNLLSNAVKFSDSGGIVRVDLTVQDGMVRIAVTDTGIGMAPAEIDKALTPFGQAKDAHIRNMDGTGLGLNIAKSLAILHGGDLELRSAPGKGTTVTILLPECRLIGTPADAVSAA